MRYSSKGLAVTGLNEPDFEQGDDHSAVNVNGDVALAFCDWLTKEERCLGIFSQNKPVLLADELCGRNWR